MPKIKIQGKNEEFPFDKGQSILDGLKKSGVSIENPCRGLGTCGKCRVRIIESPGILNPPLKTENNLLGEKALNDGIRLACSVFPENDITIEITGSEKEGKVMSEGYIPGFSRDEGKQGLGIACDIGTTTVAAELVDFETGEVLSVSSGVNPQKKYGLDVLSRISHEVEEGERGILDLFEAVSGCLRDLTLKNLKSSGRKEEEIKEYVISANTTMMHTLLRKDASAMGRFPYRPSYEGSLRVKAKSLGLPGCDSAAVYCIGHVSAFIGADIVSGVCVSELTKREGNVLFIDIGTNGEIVLKSGDRLSCCSCAAGPALEGMNISSGMRASDGAIEDIKLTPKGIVIKAIGGGKPEGLCGSGILSAVKELLKNEIIGRNGTFIKPQKLKDSDWRLNYIGINGNKREFIVNKDPYISVTQGDVRQVQLAKGAILSGFTALLKKYSISMDDLNEVLIAGQFGAHLPPDSLTGTGILPFRTEGKIKYLGNTSMTGARMALLSREVRREMEELGKKMEYVELAVTDGYEDIFRESMLFPEKSNAEEGNK